MGDKRDDILAPNAQLGAGEEVESTVTFGSTYGEQSFNNAPFDLESIYEEHRALLLYVATCKFRIPEADAESLIHEVFLSFLQRGGEVDNVRAWLVAAMCNVSRHYWRAADRSEELLDGFSDRSDSTSDDAANRVLLEVAMARRETEAVLSFLDPQCREVMRKHLFDGRSVGEIAREAGLTERYTAKLIRRCLGRARKIFSDATVLRRPN